MRLLLLLILVYAVGFTAQFLRKFFFLGVSRERGDRADMSLRENCRYVGPTNLRV